MYVSITRFAGVGMLFMLILSNACDASDASAKTQYITLDEAITRTLERNPSLLAFGYQLKIKRSRIQQAELAPNPDLIVTLEGALGTGDHQGFESAETTVSLGWVFEQAVRESRVDAALASESLTAADIEIMRVDIAAETANLFLQLMAYQSRLTNSTEAVELAKRTVQAVQERVEAGRSPQADLERALAELAFAELDLEDIQHELKTARYQLAAQWGSTQLDFETARGDPLQLPSIAPLQDLNQLALQNPLFQRYLTQQRLDDAELRLAEAQRKPGWRGAVGLRRYESTDDFALVTALTLPLAIRNRNQGNIAAAHAAAEQTFAEAAAAKVNVETSLLVLYESLQHSLHVALSLRDQVLPRIEFALTETQAAYDSGRYGYFDLRSVQAELISAKNALIEASISAHRNVIEIERLTGTRLAQAGTTP